MVQLSYYFNIIKNKYYTKKYNNLINMLLNKKYILLKSNFKINNKYYNCNYSNDNIYYCNILNIKQNKKYIKQKLCLYKHIYIRRYCIMVVPLPSKQEAGVRFPLPAFLKKSKLCPNF